MRKLSTLILGLALFHALPASAVNLYIFDFTSTAVGNGDTSISGSFTIDGDVWSPAWDLALNTGDDFSGLVDFTATADVAGSTIYDATFTSADLTGFYLTGDASGITSFNFSTIEVKPYLAGDGASSNARYYYGPGNNFDQLNFTITEITHVPEPALLLPTALVGLAGAFALYRRRRQSKHGAGGPAPQPQAC